MKTLLFVRVACLTGALAAASLSSADILYDGNKAKALGRRAEIVDGTIHWTYCNGTKEDFKKPPYRVEEGENCRLEPSIFGIAKDVDHFVVSDVERFKKFLPDANAKEGDTVAFTVNKSNTTVSIGYKQNSATIRY